MVVIILSNLQYGWNGFIIGITPLSDIEMLMMCNTIFSLLGLKVPHSVTFLGE